MKKIFSEALEAIRAGKRAALSTIVTASGSLPMARRAKMLVLPDGVLRGTVGGGCLEADVYARARELLAGEARLSVDRFTLTEEAAGAGGMVCGGTVEIMTEVLAPGPSETVLEACLEALERRREGILVTRLEPPPAGSAGKLLLRRDGSRVGSLGSEELESRAAEAAGPLFGTAEFALEDLGEQGRLFLESITLVPEVVLFGGGHVSREVARVAAAAGFRVIVVDDRAAFANPERHPEADETRVLPFPEAVASLRIDSETYLVAVTRGHQHDETVVRMALRTPAGYVGMIGSRRKVALLRKRLAAEGFTPEELERLHAPIGLDIGAETPGEIAVSIVAELIAVRRRGAHLASLSRSGHIRT